MKRKGGGEGSSRAEEEKVVKKGWKWYNRASEGEGKHWYDNETRRTWKREGRSMNGKPGLMSQHLLINNSNNNKAINWWVWWLASCENLQKNKTLNVEMKAFKKHTLLFTSDSLFLQFYSYVWSMSWSCDSLLNLKSLIAFWGGNPFVFFVFYMYGNSNKIIGVNYNLRPTIKVGWLIYIIIILSLPKCYF